MNESDFYKTVVQQEILDDGAIRRYAKSAVRRKPVFRRVLVPVLSVLGALLLVFGVTMAIPSARAEVLSWFKPTTAGEYFSQPADEREPNEQLDALIVPGEQSETHVEVQGAASDAIFTEIAKALETVELGDTMYDGETLYIQMQMNGIAALPSVEQLTFGNLTMTVIPPDLTPGYFEDNRTPPEFLSGETPLWMEAETLATFTFADGTKFYGGWISVDDADIRPLVESLRADGLDNGTYSTPEEFQTINERELAYLRDRTVNMTAVTYLASDLAYPGESDRTLYDEFRSRADENGRVTVTVGMEVVQDTGNGPDSPAINAVLGEVTIDLDAFKSLKQTELKPDGSEVIFAPEQTYFTRYDWGKDENGVPLPYVTYRNEAIDLDGLTLKGLEGAYVDARGIQNLRITVTTPKDWNQKMKEQLLDMFLGFKVQINGEELGYTNAERCEVLQNGTVTITIGCISGVPLEELKDVRTVTLIPTLSYLSVRRVWDGNGAVLSDIGLEPGVPYVDSRDVSDTLIGDTTEYPQYALTFTVD